MTPGQMGGAPSAPKKKLEKPEPPSELIIETGAKAWAIPLGNHPDKDKILNDERLRLGLPENASIIEIIRASYTQDYQKRLAEWEEQESNK